MSKITETHKQTVITIRTYLAPDITVYETEAWQLICTSDSDVPMGPEIPTYD